MNNKKPAPSASPKQLDKAEKVESIELETVVGGCGCGCAMPNCNMQMTGRRFGWR